ncbi:MAG TPA: MFS transporter [Acidimicrobiales bacterium]|nr:MFS transporter [Acidimicrobiales bacterium]
MSDGDPEERIWASDRRGLAVGLVLSITMLAFETLGVSTAMPIVADDLDGVGLYGWTFTAALLGSLIGIALAGARVDRLGPGKPFVAGLLVFAVGLVGAGSSTSMAVLVACRFVQGIGAGAVPAVVYASIGRAFGERARARMFAFLSTAWVVPGLVGPAVSGFVAEEVGWRWVFFGVLPLVPINLALTAPTLLRLGPPPSNDDVEPERRTVPRATVLAAGVAMLVGGLNRGTAPGVLLAVVGAAVAVPALRRLLPAGTFRATPGLPAAVATRGASTLAFFTAQAFLPLALTDWRGQRAAVAGLSLTLSTLTWTVGAWLQDKRGHVWGRPRLVAAGQAILVVGVTATSLVLVEGMPIVVGVITWAVAGLGMGVSYGGLSLIVLADAPAGREGRASASLQLAEQVCVAAGTGFAGAAVAAADRRGDLFAGLAATFLLAALVGVAGGVAARRLRPADGKASAVDRPAPARLDGAR